ncbi:MAG: nucleotidyltransferase domain-containing protein [Spirochaetaceae bacterium]|nr:nucleotidyltransferase domain-containing protein [Spirochaetaceae bacterium]MDE0221842.1 nucleotidyltransferase domain-containing protein [Spirochaetaceae bacterium]
MAIIEPATPSSRAAPPSLDQIRPRLAEFCAGHGIRRAIAFGSFARGTQTRRSDLDLVIVMDTKKRFLDRYDEVNAIHDEVPGVHVEMLIYTEDELRAIAHRPFMRQILREGVVVYE